MRLILAVFSRRSLFLSSLSYFVNFFPTSLLLFFYLLSFITSHRSVNIPGAKLVLPAMTELDREHLSVAVELDADFVAASFVRTAADVVTIRNYLEEMRDAHRLPDSFRIPRIIAKIESAEALQHFDEILKVSDGIMVARGDLAVEIPFSVVTRAQKMIVGKCNAAGKPVVVATQMLESMIDNPRPVAPRCLTSSTQSTMVLTVSCSVASLLRESTPPRACERSPGLPSR